jgi:hypothetical protein
MVIKNPTFTMSTLLTTYIDSDSVSRVLLKLYEVDPIKILRSTLLSSAQLSNPCVNAQRRAINFHGEALDQ